MLKKVKKLPILVLTDRGISLVILPSVSWVIIPDWDYIGNSMDLGAPGMEKGGRFSPN